MNLDVIYLPEEPANYEDTTVIIIDVLRASSTIVTAFKNGADRIYPVKNLATAEEMHEHHPSRLLCGERGGIRPGNFHMGNSPREYTKNKVGGRELILTTSNGTKAIEIAGYAASILIGSFLNLNDVAGRALAEKRDIRIVCAGNDGRVSIDDLLCAGMIVQLINKNVSDLELEDGARWAWYGLNSLNTSGTGWDKKKIFHIIKNSFHGQKLVKLGFLEDIEYCSDLSSVQITPYFSIDKLLI